MTFDQIVSLANTAVLPVLAYLIRRIMLLEQQIATIKDVIAAKAEEAAKNHGQLATSEAMHHVEEQIATLKERLATMVTMDVHREDLHTLRNTVNSLAMKTAVISKDFGRT